MTEIAISCSNVWKSYRVYHQRSHTLKEKVLNRRSIFENFWALRGVDLEVAAGTTVGVIGANGSGKSTLLKTMAGILSPNRGSVAVNGRISPLLELGTGFHPDLTGRENVYLGGSLLGCSRRDVTARYDDIVEFAGIGQFIDMPVKNYSSGMYARLAFALAVSVDPEILIVDEVLSVGDEEFQMRCQQRMAEFQAGGHTIVLVSHNPGTISSICRDAVWVEDGVVRQSGEAHAVVASYLTDVHRESGDRSVSASPGEAPAPREATITDVLFLDGDGTVRETFCTGEAMTVRVSYCSDSTIENVSLGIAVFGGDSLAYVFGHSTNASGIPLVLSGEGTVELVLPSLPFLAGNYLVTLAFESTKARKVYDLHDRRYSFVVSGSPGLPYEPGMGMVHIPSLWQVSRSSAQRPIAG